MLKLKLSIRESWKNKEHVLHIMVKQEITACIFHVALSWDCVNKRLTYYWQDARKTALGFSWSSNSHLKLWEGNCKGHNQYWSPNWHFQLGFFFNSLIQCCTTSRRCFYQTDLDQAVHYCNLLAMVVTGELHVTNGGIRSKRLLMYTGWSLKISLTAASKLFKDSIVFSFFLIHYSLITWVH